MSMTSFNDMRLILLLLLLPVVYGELITEEYNEIMVKYYDPEFRDECVGVFDSIPEEYFLGLKYIKVLPASNHSFGHYHENFVLELYGGCRELETIHELAHHRQKMMGDSSYEITHHLGRFDQFEHEIFIAVQENKGGSVDNVSINEPAGLAEITGLAILENEGSPRDDILIPLGFLLLGLVFIAIMLFKK